MMTLKAVSRRGVLAGLLASAPVLAHSASRPLMTRVEFRGGLNAEEFGVEPGAVDPAAEAFQRMLDEASRRDMPIFLPPGNYALSGIELPENVRLSGVAGATRLLYTGDGNFFNAARTKRLSLSGLVIDGANRWLADDQPGLLTLRGIGDLSLQDCEILGASKFAVWSERCSGRMTGNAISGAAESAIYAVECNGMQIRDNTVSDCGNGGILVHRWKKGRDGTIVSGNRVARILARGGGTGQNGNGINIFQADDVKVSDNHVTACAFSAIRANAGSNVQVTDNHCTASGEMAIYSEFGFEGAIISGNLVDGAANGISACNFNEGGRLSVITGNIVRNLTLQAPYQEDGQYFGIGIQAEAETVVSGNVIENVPRWALALGWGPYLRNVNVTGNIIRKAPIGCAVSVVEGARAVQISGNQFSDIGEAAIAGFRWADRVTGDLASQTTDDYPHLAISGNQTG